MMRRFVSHPVLVVIDVVPAEYGLPTKAYIGMEELHDDGTPPTKTFKHLSSDIGAEEAEEVGVEHLLRDISDASHYGSLSSKIQGQLGSLKGLFARLNEIHEYLGLVVDEKIPINHGIMYNLQEIFNLLPNLDLEEFVSSFSLKTSDQMLVVYLSSLIRATIALHNLINNKIELQDSEKKDQEKKKGSAEKSASDKESKETSSEKGDDAKDTKSQDDEKKS